MDGGRGGGVSESGGARGRGEGGWMEESRRGSKMLTLALGKGGEVEPVALGLVGFQGNQGC